MEVQVAEYAGFCFGVKRAVDLVYEQLSNGKKVYTYGPIVHNEELIAELESKGVTILTEENLSEMVFEENAVLILRAHGVSRAIYNRLCSMGVEVIDAACPFVKKIHRIVDEKSKAGVEIVIAGDPKHPEVQGILGWCNSSAKIVSSSSELLEILPNLGKNVCLVAQTTYQLNKFQEMVEILETNGYNDSVVNTICSATEERQHSARTLAKQADVMIVIGGKHSSNTQKLYAICREECANTYYIQTLDDLYLELPESVGLVGITAGASTPQKIIEEVQNNVRTYF